MKRPISTKCNRHILSLYNGRCFLFRTKTTRVCCIEMVSLLFLSSQYFVVINSLQDSSLYRNTFGGFSFGDFEKNSFTSLSVNKLAFSMATDSFDCMFLCINKPKCYSFNMATSSDSKGLYLCELLASDKYKSETKFHANDTFHHYSPKVRIECYT